MRFGISHLKFASCLAGLLALGFTAQASDLTGPWFTASNNGTPALSNPNANTFDWGSTNAGETASTGLLWSYFDAIALTSDYQYVEAHLDLRFGELPSATTAAIRFGLFHSGGSRVEENLSGSNTDARFEPSRGYWAGWSPPATGTGARLYARTGPRNNPLSTNNSSTIGPSLSNPGINATNVFYAMSFRVTRIDGTNFTIRSSLNGVTNEITTILQGTNAFDFVAFQNTSGAQVDTYQIANARLETGFDPPPPPLDLSGRPNVLFICVDDLRPEIGAYGESHMITPNLDRFADQGRLFRRHYVQSPTCGASRYAMLTGRRFTGTDGGNSNNDVLWSRRPTNEPSEAWCIPDLFRRAGYETIGMGKISHSVDCYHYGSSATEYPASPVAEMPYSWSEIIIPPSFVNRWQTGWRAFFAYADGSTRNRGVSPPLEIGIATNHPAPLYPDIDIADSAVQRLQSMGTNRFFMSVGFFKPHLPFNAPQEYFDLYPTNSLAFSPNPQESVGIDSRSNSQSGEPTNNYGHPGQPSNWHNLEETAYHAELRQGYFACVSFIDAQIGKVLDAVNNSPLATNTVVVVWGDHGWHLGDHNLWGKHTKFERAARSALIIRTPDMRLRGQQTEAIVESVDLFPTLAELCELDAPSHLDGHSLVPVLDDPQHPGKDAAITYWSGCSSLRSDQIRLVYYHNNASTEVYDHTIDPFEQTNRLASTDGMIVSNHLALVATNAPVLLNADDHYANWLTNYFSAIERADTNLVAETANPDGDGLLNLEEYLHGLHPRQADPTPALEGVYTNEIFAAQFNRSLLASDVDTVVEVSTNLQQWLTVDPDTLDHRLQREVMGTQERLLIGRETDGSRAYLRLRSNRR